MGILPTINELCDKEIVCFLAIILCEFGIRYLVTVAFMAAHPIKSICYNHWGFNATTIVSPSIIYIDNIIIDFYLLYECTRAKAYTIVYV